LTGLFVENALKLAQPEHAELALEKRRNDIFEATVLKQLLCQVDSDASGSISVAEFEDKLMSNKVRAHMEVMGLQVKDAHLFFQMLSSMSDSEEVDIDFFVEMCVKMKGTASSVDLQTLTFEVRSMNRRCNRIERLVQLMGESIVGGTNCYESEVDVRGDMSLGCRRRPSSRGWLSSASSPRVIRENAGESSLGGLAPPSLALSEASGSEEKHDDGGDNHGRCKELAGTARFHHHEASNEGVREVKEVKEGVAARLARARSTSFCHTQPSLDDHQEGKNLHHNHHHHHQSTELESLPAITTTASEGIGSQFASL